ncbi:MAG: hypothetical protein ACK4YU_08355 [Paracoccus sp. (in: a-proteobacteria)]
MTATVLTALSEIAADAPLRRAVMERIGTCDDIADREQALLMPDVPGPVSLLERAALAHHVAALMQNDQLAGRYARKLKKVAAPQDPVPGLILIETSRAASLFPDPHRISGPRRALIGDRLDAAFRYVHAALAGHGRARAYPAGWDRDSTEILSRILTMVSFQTRLLTGLRQCAATRNAAYSGR